MYARNLLIVIKLGQGCSLIFRASNHMEHTLLKGTCISRIGVLLLSNGRPLNLLGVVFVHEYCLVRPRCFVGNLLAIIGNQLLHFSRSYRQIAGMTFVSNRYRNLIQCLRCAYARIQYAECFRFTNLIGIHARLGIRNVAKVKRNRSTSRSSVRLGHLNGCSTAVGPFRHRNTDGAFGCFQKEREFISTAPAAARKHLFALKNLPTRKRARCAIGIHHFRIYRLTSYNSARKVCSSRSESSTISLRNFIAPTAVKAVYVQRFACLQVVLCLALSVERQGKRVANLIAARILHHGAEALVRGFGNINSELKRVVIKIAQLVAFRHLQLLRYRQRAREVGAQLAVVAQVGSNLARANPLRVQHVNGSPGIIRGFCLVKLVKIRQSSST